ncbi:MAG: ribonuclease Y [Bdellovibrionaceae bacterium]|nr:ribonuclease Y [Pseudobdellovibrionaceae bacterium]
MSIAIIAISLCLGLTLAWVLHRWQRRQELKSAEIESQELVDEALEKAADKKSELEAQLIELKDQLQIDYDEYSAPKLVEIERLQERSQAKASELEAKQREVAKQVRRLEQSVKDKTKRVERIQAELRARRDNLKSQREKIVEALKAKVKDDPNQLIAQLKDKFIEEAKRDAQQDIQAQEELDYAESERRAKRTIYSILNRFERAYSPERGIPNINFADERVMKKVCGENGENVKILEEMIGVDLTLFPEKLFLNVSGFDPVRRELTRLTVERLMKDKWVDQKRIQQMVEQSKRQLFRKIRSDGNRIAKELRLKNMHGDVRDMLGSLRYRYSFSQNQFYHVGEVGWLCGLLCAELGLDESKGRRAGVLHDIGKAMDHSIDGGHAVIGADFIDKHGEAKDVVHAVRAHHFDEQPSTELAYLTIAADAISGARPGARRSTADSYSQKMADLERIGRSTRGVTATYILNAGRELRVMVDSKKVDDMKALQLSQELAHKIEEDMAFPGTIRVTVVRETQAVEYAK